MSLGLGIYQRPASLPDARLGLYLVHLRPQVAVELAAREPYVVVGGRFDSGDDEHQADFGGDPLVEADRFVAQAVMPAVAQAGAGVYSFATGLNERWPDKTDIDGLRWRSAFEHRACRRLQYGDDMPDWWRLLPYAWGGISVGCLEPEHLGLFADVIQDSWATNYHGYLTPSVRSVADESEPWHLWRPTRRWLPELRRLGLTTRLLLGECGPYYPELQGADLARCQVEIGRAMAAECEAVGLYFVGAIAYGWGLYDKQAPWELEGTEAIWREVAAGQAAEPPSEPGGGVDPPTEQQEGPVTELERWASDVFKRAGVPFNPDAAITRYWLDSARRGQYLGRPEGPEHNSEAGIPYQEFAGAVLHWQGGVVHTGLPF